MNGNNYIYYAVGFSRSHHRSTDTACDIYMYEQFSIISSIHAIGRERSNQGILYGTALSVLGAESSKNRGSQLWASITFPENFH